MLRANPKDDYLVFWPVEGPCFGIVLILQARIATLRGERLWDLIRILRCPSGSCLAPN